MRNRMRLNKYLAQCGVCSRRDADKLIEQGKVLVNGQVAGMGQQVEETDTVQVGKKILQGKQTQKVLAFYKPVGVTCTERDPHAEKKIMDMIRYPERLTYAGRLDKDSEGLILLTNDGDLINAMMRGANRHEKEYIVKTIVTTETIKTIAERNGVEMYDVYTGFKWIANVMRENEGKKNYIGGGEESYGFLCEDFVRDKDAVSACVILAEIAAWAKDQGLSLYQLLQKIYVEYGFSKEKGISVVKKGKSGAEEIEAMMKKFRENPLTEIAGSKVTYFYDYSTLKGKDYAENETVTLDMPTTSNVLQYFTEDNTKVSIRPSGTEPKIKFYCEVHSKVKSIDELPEAEKAAEEKINQIKASLGI